VGNKGETDEFITYDPDYTKSLTLSESPKMKCTSIHTLTLRNGILGKEEP